MSKGVSAVEYIMEDPREAMRLEVKVDAHAWVQKYLAHRVGAGAEVLSVGCGPGVILREVVALGRSIQGTGLDVSDDRIREAKQRHRGVAAMSFVRGAAHEMEFPSNRFDLVYSRMLLEYLRNKEQAVREMVRVCRPGGTLQLPVAVGWVGGVGTVLRKAMCQVSPRLPSMPSLASRYSYTR